MRALILPLLLSVCVTAVTAQSCACDPLSLQKNTAALTDDSSYGTIGTAVDPTTCDITISCSGYKPLNIFLDYSNTIEGDSPIGIANKMAMLVDDSTIPGKPGTMNTIQFMYMRCNGKQWVPYVSEQDYMTENRPSDPDFWLTYNTISCSQLKFTPHMRHPRYRQRLVLVGLVALLVILAITTALLLIDRKGMTSDLVDGICGDMQFIAYSGLNETSRGRNFFCHLKSYLDQWQISDEFVYNFEPINPSKVAFVTYSSSNHFAEARQGIRSIRSQFTNKIVFYDLGLTNEEIAELNDVCNLEVRKFNFHRYPEFVSHLLGYNFKAIIMAEVFAEFEAYWIVDTSIRFFNATPFLNEFYTRTNSGTIETMALRHPASHSIFATTDPRMYEYLPIDASLAKRLVMFEANTMFIARSELSRQAVKWNSLCALTSDCMAPPGSKVNCTFPLPDRYSSYVNCHRYDQSSINIIVSSLLDKDGWNRDRLRDNAMIMFSQARREDDDSQPLSIPCQ